MSTRYTACSLALELGWWDVDAMLESMTVAQYLEWLAFFRIRAEKPDGTKTAAGQKRMAASLNRALDGYQKRMDMSRGK